MDERRPKRRRDKDNPYTLSCRDGRYYITFKDGQSVDQCIEINEELFQVFDSFELEDLRYLNVVDRHIEWAEVCEETLYKRANEYEETTEEQVIRRLNVEKLHTAILALPEMQRRRVVRYYFWGMTYKKIAEIEHSSVSSVARSILAAKRAVKRLLE